MARQEPGGIAAPVKEARLKRTAASADAPAMRRTRPGLLLLFLFAGAMRLGAEGLRVNVDAAHPPFMYARNGLPDGVYAAIIHAAFQRIGIPLVLEPKPWQRCLHELDSGLAGVGGLFKSADRQMKYDFSEPFFVETLVLYYHAAQPIAYSGIEDFTHLRIGVLSGWSYGDAFDRSRTAGAFWVEEVATDVQNFMKLDDRRLDAVLAVQEAGASLLPRHRNVRAARAPFRQSPVHLAFSKQARQEMLLKRFNAAIQELKRTGALRHIIAAELAKPR